MKIKLKIELADGKTVELSEDKARELYLKLDEYFGQKDYILPYIPWPFESVRPPFIPWCGDSTDGILQTVEITC